MKYKTALSIIGDNPIGLLTWGQIILPPANAKLSKVHLSVTMDHTGNELMQMIAELSDRDRIVLMEAIIDVENMTVQPAEDPEKVKKHNTLPYVVAISALTMTFALVAYDLMSKDTVLNGESLADVLKHTLQLVFSAFL